MRERILMDSQDKKKGSMTGGVGSLVVQDSTVTAPSVLTSESPSRSTAAGELLFRPYFVQVGRGPHLLDWAYATDEQWDSFHSNITASNEGVKISDTEGKDKFGINVRWNVEGFGYIFITADNAGEFYTLPPAGKSVTLNLNYELAKRRRTREGKPISPPKKDGGRPSREVESLVSISEGYLADAKSAEDQVEKCGALSQKALLHAMWASEKIELDYANHAIAKQGRRPHFWTGCDARGYFQMDVE